MRDFVYSLLIGGALCLGATQGAYAGAGDPNDPDRLADKLQDRGYRYIQVDAGHYPGPQAFACKGNTHFQIDFDTAGNIADVDPIGDCTARSGPKNVRVQAPFVDVQVGSGVRVRAPFVDLNIR